MIVFALMKNKKNPLLLFPSITTGWYLTVGVGYGARADMTRGVQLNLAIKLRRFKHADPIFISSFISSFR